MTILTRKFELFIYITVVLSGLAILPLKAQDITDDQLLDFIQMQQNRTSNNPESNQEQPNEDQVINEDQEQKEENDFEEEEIVLPDFDLSAKSINRINDYQLERFGYEIFKGASSSFNVTPNAIVPDDYIVGPNDVIKIIIFGTQNPRYNLEVTREGEIYVPQIGPIEVSGLTFLEMKDYVSEKIEEKIIGVKTSITLGKLRSINVFIVGGSVKPGNYLMSSMTTVVNAIFRSGGVNESGSLRNIELRRKGKLISRIDLYDLLLKGDTSNDPILQDGDVILIANVGKTSGVAGDVRRPAIFELKENETVKDLIQFAGGIMPSGDRTKSQIQRITDKRSFTMIDLDLTKDKSNNEVPKDGDIIRVYPLTKNFDDVVLLSGSIKDKGFYQWRNNLKVSDIVTSFDDLMPQTDRNYTLIKRENKSTGNLEFYQSSIVEILKNNNSKYNHSLMPRDEIFFFDAKPSFDIEDEVDLEDPSRMPQQADNNEENSTQLEDEQLLDGYIDSSTEVLVVKDRYIEKIPKDKLALYEDQGFERVLLNEELSEELEIRVRLSEGDRNLIIVPLIYLLENQYTGSDTTPVISIGGSVLFPGKYPLTKGMNLTDAIYASGGLKDGVNLMEIELLRSEKKNNSFIYKRQVLSLNNSGNFILMPGDAISLKSLEQSVRTVDISGEVNYPGNYAVGDNETINDLINRAGGLKDTAFRQGAVFLRESIKEDEADRLEKLSKTLRQQLLVSSTQSQVGSTQQDIDTETIDGIIATIANTEATGRLVINMEAIQEGIEVGPILENNDSLFIPKRSQVISVIGEIRVASSHMFKKGNSVNDYIEVSGGITEFASEGDIYIITASGSILDASGSGFFRGQLISPGDTIVVPLKTQQYSNLQAANEVTQVIYQIAVATAAISGINN